MYKVSEAAALSGLTVRALHHYDAIGLLQPSTRSDAGYRLYRNDDVRTLRRIRRYQGFGFSLEEIGELLAATTQDRLTALRKQRDAIRQRASEAAAIMRAINKEITMENTDEKEPADRPGRAQALVSEYLDRSKSEPVSRLSPLLAEALDLLRPLTTGKSMDPVAVKLAVWIHRCRCDWANLADLGQGFLDQDPDFDDRAFTACTPGLFPPGHQGDRAATGILEERHPLRLTSGSQGPVLVPVNGLRAMDEAHALGFELGDAGVQIVGP